MVRYLFHTIGDLTYQLPLVPSVSTDAHMKSGFICTLWLILSSSYFGFRARFFYWPQWVIK